MSFPTDRREHGYFELSYDHAAWKLDLGRARRAHEALIEAARETALTTSR